MPMIYQFRALSDENDHFVRDYQLMYDDTLRDFHNFICADLNFDPGSMASFFLSDRNWDKLREFTLYDMGDGPDGQQATMTMEGATLHEVIEDNGDRLIYTFDIFGDRSLYMEMTGVYKSTSGEEYPRTLLSEGKAPGQFNAGETADDDSMFDEAMDEFEEFEGDDNYQDEF